MVLVIKEVDKMKKVSRILYLVGSIWSIFVLIFSIVMVVFFAKFGGQIISQTMENLIEKGTITEEETELYLAIVTAMVNGILNSFITRIVTYPLAIVFGFIASSGIIKGKLNIIGIVLGVLAPTIFIPAAILGMIGDKKEKNASINQEENK